MRLPRRLLLVLLGILAALVALEVALQVVAWVVWLSRQRPVAVTASDGAAVVMCVGDSFTYGLGAEDLDNAYPRALERALRAPDAPPVHAVNLGWPGSDSRAVLAKLPRDLAAYHPALVYVLVGYNDFWSERAPPQDDSFPIELRTLRLLRMVVHALRGGPNAPAAGDASALIGSWHAGDVELTFAPDGRIESQDGPLELRWSAAGEGRIALLALDADRTIEAGWRVDGGALVLEGGPFPQGLRLDPGPLDRNALDRARARVRAGDDATAERLFREALPEPSFAPSARAGLAALLARTGRGDEARAVLAPLADDPVQRRRFAEAAVAIGDVDAGLAVVADLLERGGVDDALVKLLLRHALRARDPAALRAAVERALRRGDLTDDQRIGLYGAAASLGGDDPDSSTRALLEIWRLRPDAPVFTRTVVWNPERFPDAAVARACADAGLAPDEVERFQAAVARARSTENRTADALADNLHRIVTTCRSAGAEPVLLDYPIARPDVETAVARVADALAVGHVAVRAHFDGLLRSGARSDWFVLDGHLNDRGYVELGRLVAEDARPRLRR